MTAYIYAIRRIQSEDFALSPLPKILHTFAKVDRGSPDLVPGMRELGIFGTGHHLLGGRERNILPVKDERPNIDVGWDVQVLEGRTERHRERLG